MSDLLGRVGATSAKPSRTLTEPAPPRLQILLREIVVEELGMIVAYRELSDLAGQCAEDIWTGSCPRTLHDLTAATDGSLFDKDLKLFLNMQVISVGNTWGLHSAMASGNVEPMRELLVRRYRYADDDAPHPDLLDLIDESGALRPLI